MKPFKTEGDAWRFLAQMFEWVEDGKMTPTAPDNWELYHGAGLCEALSWLHNLGGIPWTLYCSMLKSAEILHDPGVVGFWWPYGDVSVRALACAFLAVLADEGETCDA